MDPIRDNLARSTKDLPRNETYSYSNETDAAVQQVTNLNDLCSVGQVSSSITSYPGDLSSYSSHSDQLNRGLPHRPRPPHPMPGPPVPSSQQQQQQQQQQHQQEKSYHQTGEDSWFGNHAGQWYYQPQSTYPATAYPSQSDVLNYCAFPPSFNHVSLGGMGGSTPPVHQYPQYYQSFHPEGSPHSMQLPSASSVGSANVLTLYQKNLTYQMPAMLQSNNNDSFRPGLQLQYPCDNLNPATKRDAAVPRSEHRAHITNTTTNTAAKSRMPAYTGASTSSLNVLPPTSTTTGPFPVSRKRVRASPEQNSRLMQEFLINRYPSTARRIQMAEELHLTPRKVQIWFQNQRQACRIRQSEHHATTLH